MQKLAGIKWDLNGDVSRIQLDYAKPAVITLIRHSLKWGRKKDTLIVETNGQKQKQ